MKVIVVHGIADDEKDNPQSPWMFWLKEKLNEKGISCFVSLMPKAWNPNYSDWKKEFEKIEIDEDDILIGHSAGASFLVRWLGEKDKKVRKLILVAPWKVPSLEYPKGENEMYNFKINSAIKNNVKDIIIFSSNDEDEEGIISAKIFEKELKGRLVELKNQGHFDTYSGLKEFSELLEEVLN
ncbi:hypothetical protein GW931_03370 [archaeon]|nr:hypothetical protein [archaeon]